MVPDLLEPDDTVRRKCMAVAADLYEVRQLFSED